MCFEKGREDPAIIFLPVKLYYFYAKKQTPQKKIKIKIKSTFRERIKLGLVIIDITMACDTSL